MPPARKSAVPERVTLPYQWVARPYQRPAWQYLYRGGKRAVLVWPRRHGKDSLGMHWACAAAHQRAGNYWHMLPIAGQARKAIWEAVSPHTGVRRIDEAFPPFLRARTRDTDMLIEFLNGSTWQVVGSDNYNSLVGSTPAGIVYSEWALADPDAWTYLRPILAENGGWALFITTPRGRNHAATMFEAAKRDPEWFAELLRADQTGVFSAETLAAERREMIDLLGEDEGDARYRQEYLCDFAAAMPGSYYGRHMQRAEDEGRIGRVPHDANAPVETWWDLGISDSTACWFVQRCGAELHVIDFYEASGEGLAHYVNMLQRKSVELGYVYSEHVFPHDLRTRELGSGESREQTLRNLGVRPVVQGVVALSDKGYRADGIEQVRRQLVRCYFDVERCKRGIDALRQYRREWDEQRQAFKDVPLHDWSSHAADAFRVGCMHRPQVGRDAPVNVIASAPRRLIQRRMRR